MKIFKCKDCGNIVGVIKDCDGDLKCCETEMIELKANISDGASEKHVPVVKIHDNEAIVTCGEVLHPMEDNHYIEFMLIETNKGYSIKYLNPGDKPECIFHLNTLEKVISAYAYCNLHGLWVSNL